MNLTKNLVAGAVFAAVMFAAGHASAAVTADVNVNVRQSPGGSVVDVMRAGEAAELVRRSGDWCQLDRARGRTDGWVACRLITETDDDGRGGRGDGDDRGSRGGDGVDVGIVFEIPGFRFEIGQGGFDDRPRRRGGRSDRVCFYEHVNYEGRSFCARSGERLRALGSWNDTISSIRVRGDAEALVCEHNGFRGRCVTIDRSVRTLGRRGNDIISSIRVR